MNGEGHGMAQSEHAAEVVGAGAEMSNLTQKLQRMTFFLKRIGFRISGAINFDIRGLHLHFLSFPL